MVRLKKTSHTTQVVHGHCLASVALLICGLVAAASLAAQETPSPLFEADLSLGWAIPNASNSDAILRVVDATGTESTNQIRVPWRGKIAVLPPARIRVEAESIWAPETPLELATLTEIAVWPAAEVRGSWALETPDPAHLQVSFQPPRLSAQEKPQKSPSGTSTCSLAERSFSCRLPAATLDLRLEAPGFVPLYFWNQTFKAERPLDLRSLQLEKGASVAGWVVVPPGIDPAQVEVALDVSTTGFQGDPVLGTQLARKSRKTGVDPRGFFQMKALEPGVFSISARAPEIPAGPSVPVQIKRDEELVLPSPLELPEAGRLRVFLEPGALPWTFSILSRPEGSHVSQLVQSATPDETGWLMLEGLPTGDFDYQVTDSKNGIWTSGSFSIVPGPNPPLVIEIPQIPVKGIVSVGEEGVASLITFGAMGDRQIPIESGEDGHFSGYLPRGGRWEIAAELADAGYIRLPPVEVAAKGGELKIRIPAAVLSGQVFESGTPKKDALVIVKDAAASSARIHGSAVTDDQGRFQIKGLEGGKREILARSQDRQSEVLDLTIEDADKIADLRLDLLESRILRGRILADGFPLPAASIEALPEPRRLGRAQATTDIEGRFELRLPAGTVGASLVVLARGYGAAIGRVSSFDGEFNLALQSSFGDLFLNGIECRPQTHLLSYNGAHLDLFDFFAILSNIDQATNGPDSLRLNGLAPGPYLICEQGTGKCLETYVTPGNTTTSSWSRRDRNSEGTQ